MIRRNLGLDLARATEAAALSAGRWMGFGQRGALDQLDLNGYVVVGEEGKLDQHLGLVSGQKVGTGQGAELDIVVDPIDGRNLLARGYANAMAVAGAAPRGSMWAPPPGAAYMNKVVVNRVAADSLVEECMDAPAAWTLALVARVKRKAVRDLIVFVLDRPRHKELIDEIRSAGARVLIRSDGDIAGALMASFPDGKVDLLMGVGGVAEGVIAACAVKALGGAMLGRLAPQSDEEWIAVKEAGLNTRHILTCDGMVASEDIFFTATGITDGALLAGVHYRGSVAETETMVLRAETKTRRIVKAEHILEED